MKNLTHQRMLFASCAASALFVNQHAIAQTDSVTQASRTEDIVVTARRREENLQTTPVGIDYSYRGKIAWGAFSGTSPFKASVAGASYGLLGARFTLSQIPLGSSVKGEIALYGRNLTNKQYVTQGIDFVLFGTKTFGDRRTIGVDAKLTF